MKNHLMIPILSVLLSVLACEKKEEDTSAMSELDSLKQSAAFQDAQAKQKEEAFLADNKTQEGVMTTESGLQYKILQLGKGDKPAEGDSVVVHSKGTLISGAEFENTQALSLEVGETIPGLAEALQLMNTGSKYKFFIPSDLAYGDTGNGDKIGPHATLIYEIDLVEIKKPPVEAAKKKSDASVKHKLQKSKKQKQLKMMKTKGKTE